MSDITHCGGEGCPLKNRCYRFRMRAYGRRDFFGSPPYDAATGQCEYLDDIARLAVTEEQIRYRAYMLWLAGGRQPGSADNNWHQAREQLEAQLAERLIPPADG